MAPGALAPTVVGMAPAVAGSAAGVWQIARPSGPGIPGVSMAGFHQRASGPIDLEVVPFPAVTICIDLGSRETELRDGAGSRHRSSVVMGMAPTDLRVRGREVACLQVRLSPVLTRPLLGVTEEATGTLLALEDVWGRAAVELEERLATAPTWSERFAIVEHELARRLDGAREADPELASVWRLMLRSRGRAQVEELADDLGWSRKRLWSRFRRQLGIGPKRAAQLIRFDHAAHRLAGGLSPAAAAAESGYADQSHLHRDARAFTGKTPRAVASAAWLAVDDVAWPRASHCPAP